MASSVRSIVGHSSGIVHWAWAVSGRHTDTHTQSNGQSWKQADLSFRHWAVQGCPLAGSCFRLVPAGRTSEQLVLFPLWETSDLNHNKDIRTEKNPENRCVAGREHSCVTSPEYIDGLEAGRILETLGRLVNSSPRPRNIPLASSTLESSTRLKGDQVVNN
ncbi:hypothetical protein RRG08_057662 [Elysia crispata]|uniref:Uncharacterized protein n=1 Tax=Elysia crispata TaxID=231223 RepID=A0AAE1A2W9_9GAST|nr:hypothetical protein RRG08_057662 [Elysia crispata]